MTYEAVGGPTSTVKDQPAKDTIFATDRTFQKLFGSQQMQLSGEEGLVG
jgi:hypothetical protein